MAGLVSQADRDNWNAAFGWGNHATANYLTTETDPAVNALGKATLSCAAGQVAKYNGVVWECAADTRLSEAEVDGLVANW